MVTNLTLTEDADKPETMDRLKPYFRPEFLNRFDAVIEFSHLVGVIGSPLHAYRYFHLAGLLGTFYEILQLFKNNTFSKIGMAMLTSQVVQEQASDLRLYASEVKQPGFIQKMTAQLEGD